MMLVSSLYLITRTFMIKKLTTFYNQFHSSKEPHQILSNSRRQKYCQYSLQFQQQHQITGEWILRQKLWRKIFLIARTVWNQLVSTAKYTLKTESVFRCKVPSFHFILTSVLFSQLWLKKQRMHLMKVLVKK